MCATDRARALDLRARLARWRSSTPREPFGARDRLQWQMRSVLWWIFWLIALVVTLVFVALMTPLRPWLASANPKVYP
jgi:hypothetical protein